MPVIRFSAAPESDDNTKWRLYGEAQDGALSKGVDLALGASDLGTVARDDSRYLDQVGGPIHDYVSAFADAEGLGDAEQPIVVFLHGFQFDPRIKTDEREGKSSNAHVQLYHFRETHLEGGEEGFPGSTAEHDSHATPWLRRAAPDRGGDAFPGLAIAYAYESWGGALKDEKPTTFQLFKALGDVERRRGRLRNVYARAFLDADRAADALAGILIQLDALLTARGDTREIDFFAHSLGTRTALLTLEKLASRHPQSGAFARVGRTLLLAGSASWLIGSEVLKALRAARSANPPEIYNFTSSTDDILTLLGARAAARATLDAAERRPWWITRAYRFIRGGKVIGVHGRPKISALSGGPYMQWVDVQLDDEPTQSRAAGHGFTLVGDRSNLADVLDHWVHYTDPRNWDLYRAIIYDRTSWDVARIRREISPG